MRPGENQSMGVQTRSDHEHVLRRSIVILRWIARIWSILSTLTIAAFATSGGHAPTANASGSRSRASGCGARRRSRESSVDEGAKERSWIHRFGGRLGLLDGTGAPEPLMATKGGKS